MEIKGKKIAVLGLSAPGLSMIKAIAKAGGLVTGFGLKKESEREQIRQSLKGCTADLMFDLVPEDALRKFDLVVLTTFWGNYKEACEDAVKHGIPVTSDLDFVYSYIKAPTIGVTGTCGKTTTTSLISKMLKAAGYKVLEMGGDAADWGSLIGNSSKYDYCLLELSSSRLQHSKIFKPHIAVFLNLFPAHGDRHGGSFLEYGETKAKIFQNQTEQDYLVYYAEAGNIHEFIKRKACKAKLVRFALQNEVHVPGIHKKQSEFIWDDGSEKEIFSIKNSKLASYPTSQLNAMAAVCVAKLCKVKSIHIQKVLNDFESLPGRLEVIRNVNGVSYIDDSRSTNIGSAIWALNSYSVPIVWIVGGEFVHGSRLNRLPAHIKGKVKLCIAVGHDADNFEKFISGLAPVQKTSTLQEAVDLTYKIAQEGDVVLFSPSAPPDKWGVDSSLERGAFFRKYVKSLKKQVSVKSKSRPTFSRI